MKINKMKLWEKRLINGYALSMLIEEATEADGDAFKKLVDEFLKDKIEYTKPMKFQMLCPGEYVISFWTEPFDDNKTEYMRKLVDEVTDYVKINLGGAE